jgi:RNA polymerase primary sigma factor
MFKGKGPGLGSWDELLTRYLKDLSALPTLSREEEIKLARRIQRGDREAIRELVEGNLRFVVSVAAKYSDSRIPLIDLINEGNIGLIKAAEKFNPDKGVKFITYAVWWVVAAIKHALVKQTGVIGLPLKHPHTIYKIHRKKEALSQQLGRDPTRDEVAEALGLSPQNMELSLMATRRPLFLDAAISEDMGVSYSNTIKADFKIDEVLLEESLREEIGSLVETLSERERDIISMRFGLKGDEPMTLRQIGKIKGLSKERIRQIEEKALERLQIEARSQGLEPLLS